MPSSWDVYHVVFLSAVLALGIPATLAAVSFFVTTTRKPKKLEGSGADTSKNAASQTVLGQKMNARFFLAANAALVLITLILILVPCVGMLQAGGNSGEGGFGGHFRTLLAIITIAGFAALGLLYSARKGDLSWLGSFQKNE